MSRETQLYIKVNNDYQEVDLFDDVVIPLTFKVTDIRNFGSKTSGYSLDFDIPHTNNNAILFGLNSEIDTYESSFEVGKDYPAYITTNSLTIFSGNFRLKKVIKKNRGTYIYYVGNLYGGAKTFVEQLGNETLIGNDDSNRDLNFSEYFISANDFTLQEMQNRLNLRWNEDGEDWGLCLIDKNNHAATPFSGGLQIWYSNELTPYLHIKQILDKIFEGTEYSYTSEFLNCSEYVYDNRWLQTIGQYNFKNLIYPYTKHNSTFGVLGDLVTLYVKQATENDAQIYGLDEYPIDWGSDDFMVWIEYTQISQMNSGTYSYSVPRVNQYMLLNWQPARNGKYNINISMPFKIGFMFAYYYTDLGQRYRVKYTQQHAYTHEYTYPLEAIFKLCTMRQNTEVVLYEQNFTWQLTEGFELDRISSEVWDHQSTGIYGKDGEFTDTFVITNEEVLLNATDVLYIRIDCNVPYKEGNLSAFWAITSELGNNTTLSPAPRIYTKTQPTDTQIMSFEQVSEFAENQDFDPTAILNPKTKKIDFFNNLVKMFNLYIEDVSNKTNYTTGEIYGDKTLRIEPYQMFYTPQLSGNLISQKDWTDKVDWESVEYSRVDTLLYNIQKFQYKHDNDYFTAQYNDTYQLPYGDYLVNGKYCTNDETNEINTNFGSFICGVVNDSTDEMQMPKIFTLNNKGEVDTKKEYSDACFFMWYNVTQHTFIQVKSSVYPSSSILISQYYCADTINNGYGISTADLNFGMSNEYLQNLDNYSPTQNNLFNAFYGEQYNEWSAPDARIMKANFYLGTYDIATLQLCDTIVINGNSFHILSIDQWENEKTPCTIELIKSVPIYAGTQSASTIIDVPTPVTPEIPIDDPVIIK